MRTVYVQQGDLLPVSSCNVPYWNDLDNVNGPFDGRLHHDKDGAIDKETGEELEPVEFTN